MAYCTEYRDADGNEIYFFEEENGEFSIRIANWEGRKPTETRVNFPASEVEEVLQSIIDVSGRTDLTVHTNGTGTTS